MKKLGLIAILSIAMTGFAMAQNDLLLVKPNGRVIIGDTTQITISGNYRLFVQEGVLTERVKVALKNTAQWSDDAFDHTPSLEEVEDCIEEESHLAGMPSASHLVSQQGYDVMTMDAKLLEQIEWLWQHVISLSDEVKTLKSELDKCKAPKDE